MSIFSKGVDSMFDIDDYKFINKIKSEYGRLEFEEDEGQDKAIFTFNRNLTDNQWKELIIEFSEYWSKRGYVCEVDNEMLRMKILPSYNSINLTRDFNKPLFTKVKKMIITLIFLLAIIIGLSVLAIHVQRNQLDSQNTFFNDYKYYVWYYILIWIFISSFVLLFFINKNIRKTIVDTLINSFFLDITIYIIIMFINKSRIKELIFIEKLYLSIDIFVLVTVISIIVSFFTYRLRVIILNNSSEELKEYNYLKIKKTSNDSGCKELINYIDKHKLNINEIVLPRSGIKDILGILNVKAFKEEPKTLEDFIIFPLFSILLVLLMLLFLYSFPHLTMLDLFLLFALIAVNISVKTYNQIKNDKKNLLYALYILKKIKI